MKTTILSAISACALFASAPAWANPVQIGNLGSASQVYGDGSAASSSHATGGTATAKGGKGGSVTVNIANPAADPTAGSNKNASGKTHTAHAHHHQAASDPAGDPSSSTSYDSGRRPVASAVAPSVMSFNPCSGSSTSGAAQFAPFGISFGTGGGFDNACRLHMLGQDKAAIAYLCRANSDIRQAFKDIGEPCPEDVRVVPIAAVAPPPNQKYRYDYCYTASAGELRQHKECEASER